MTESIQQNNFAPGKIPDATDPFHIYSSHAFAHNLLAALSTIVQRDDNAHAKSSKELDQSITGQN